LKEHLKMTNVLTNQVENVGVDLIVAGLVNAGTGGDATKKAARAAGLLAVFQADLEIVNGNVTQGVTDLVAAFQSKALDPGLGLAVHNAMSVLSVEASALLPVEENTIGGQIDIEIAQSILTDAVAAAQAYIPATILKAKDVAHPPA
jgi:hypothetical protein